MPEKEPKPWTAEPAESFEIEYGTGNANGQARNLFANLRFRFNNQVPGEGTVTYNGKHPDGTTVTITFKKGGKYKSPKQLAEEAAAK